MNGPAYNMHIVNGLVPSGRATCHTHTHTHTHTHNTHTHTHTYTHTQHQVGPVQTNVQCQAGVIMGDMHTSACLHCHRIPLGLQEYREYCYTSDVFKGVVWGQTHGCVYSGGGGGEKERA